MRAVMENGSHDLGASKTTGIKKGSLAPLNGLRTKHSERPTTSVEHHQCDSDNHGANVQFTPFT